MPRPLSFESVLKLIEEGGYGTYRLFLLPANTFVGGSHITDDEKDVKKPASEIIKHLTDKMVLLEDVGLATYRIHLKKTNQTQVANEVRYEFNYPAVNNGSTAAQSQMNGYGGYNTLSGDKLEEIIEQRVSKALTLEREKSALQRQVDELDRKFKDLQTEKRRRAPVNKFAGALKGLTDMGKIAMATFIAEKYPKAVPLVKDTLKTMMDGQDEEEEEEEEEQRETGFQRPEQE